ncbi:hypothetical protein EVAR_4974_1 [Eumeta japonica]|uniref:Uncharacterized protein n=1 Tax=Eumeta variegata TaxID=151549 RepID=A0A4C1UZ42_EUMVA|nr:hypothetical protein EVAR_4974_1 [Eumeta japonica]
MPYADAQRHARAEHSFRVPSFRIPSSVVLQKRKMASASDARLRRGARPPAPALLATTILNYPFTRFNKSFPGSPATLRCLCPLAQLRHEP